MKAGLELSDVPEGFLIPVVATLGVVGNLGKEQFLKIYLDTNLSDEEKANRKTIKFQKLVLYFSLHLCSKEQ